MLLYLEVHGESYVADVGFGGLTLTGPLRLEMETEQATPHEPYRLLRAGEEFEMQAKIRGAWQSLYLFDLQAQHESDYEVHNWYLCNHPHSPFVNGLMAGRPTPDRRYALYNNELAVHHLNGSTERRTLTTAAELRETLAGTGRLTLPDAPELDASLARLAALSE
jgi:N-hydroxyarylamine O-acetyltransferase